MTFLGSRIWSTLGNEKRYIKPTQVPRNEKLDMLNTTYPMSSPQWKKKNSSGRRKGHGHESWKPEAMRENETRNNTQTTGTDWTQNLIGKYRRMRLKPIWPLCRSIAGWSTTSLSEEWNCLREIWTIGRESAISIIVHGPEPWIPVYNVYCAPLTLFSLPLGHMWRPGG